MRSADPNDIAGKTIRLRDDGTVPPDNPFVNRPGYKKEIYTLGHRNGHSMQLNPETGELWVTEQGPNGGDEINILKPGGNYGWPIVSLGRSYPGPWQSPTFSKEGFESPVVYWMPSISLSGMAFYTGDKLPRWKGDIFVGGQRTGEIPGTGRLERILVNEKLEELRREALLVPLGMRIRDVRQGPDQLLYVLVDHENGGILRIEPSATRQVPTTYSARPPR
jgi:glucose/arabinose dehydrogenase